MPLILQIHRRFNNRYLVCSRWNVSAINYIKMMTDCMIDPPSVTFYPSSCAIL